MSRILILSMSLGLMPIGPFANGQESVPTSVATKGELRVEANVAGVFVADDKDEVRIEPEEYRGELIVMKILPEGIAVKKGEVLMEFDTSKLDEPLEEAQYDAIDAFVAFKKAEAEYRSATIDLEAKPMQLQKELAFLQREVESAIAWQAIELAKKERGIADAERTQRELLVDFETLKAIYQERGLQTSTSGDILIGRENKKIASSEKSIAFKKKELEYFKQFDKSKAQLEKEIEIEKKLGDIRKQKITLEAAVAEKKSVVDKAQRKLDTANRKVEGMESDRDHLRVVSPRDGILFYGQTGKEPPAGVIISGMPDTRKELRVGGRVRTHTILLTVATMDNLSIKMQLLENDIQHIRRDLPITVHPDAYPSLQFDGRLTQVDQIATRIGFMSNARRFTVMGKCVEKTPQLRAGMNCRVTVHMVAIQEAIQVPIVAVFEKRGVFYCFVKDGAKTEQRKVTIGLCNEDSVQIITGIQLGEVVCLKDPSTGN